MADRYAELRAALETGYRNGGLLVSEWKKTSQPDTIRALLADYDRMRDALRWNAAALNECCKECIREASNITIADETKSFSEILDMADAALEQEQP